MTASLSPQEELRRSTAAIRARRGSFTALGIVWIVLGMIAIVAPFVATLAAELLIGALLATGGVVQLVHAFRVRDWSGFATHVLGGILALVTGLFLLIFPIPGILSLTLVLAFFFLVIGGMRVYAGLRDRGESHWGWVVASGGLAILIGIVLFLGWPQTAFWAIGLLVGVELIIGGWALIMVARGLRQLDLPPGSREPAETAA